MFDRSHFRSPIPYVLPEIGESFSRVDLRHRARACVRGLLETVSRKNAWQLTEYGGDLSPWGQQHLPDRSRREAVAVRDFTHQWLA